MPTSQHDNKPKLVITTFYAITLVIGFEMGGFQLSLLRAANEFGFAGTVIGIPITIYFISIILFPLIFGPIADKIGKKNIIAVFMFVFVIGGLLVWASSSIIHFLFGIFVISAGFSICLAIVTAAVSDLYAEKSEKYINLCQSFFCIGATISPIILYALMNNTSASWRVNFLLCAIAMAAILPFLLKAHIKPIIKNETTEKYNQIERPLLLLGFIICMCAYVGIEASVAFFADTIFTLEFDVPAYGAIAIALYWAFMGVGRICIGQLKKIPAKVIAISLFVLAIIFACIIFNRHEIVMLVLFAAAGLSCACIWPGIISSAVSINQRASGRVIGYLNIGSGIGGMFIPLINGAIINTAGIPFSFLLLIIISVSAGSYMWKNVRLENL